MVYHLCTIFTASHYAYYIVLNKFISLLRLYKICTNFSGHCVEFNLLGGVIQDQMSFPCNNIFPKCDAIFRSTDAYKCNTLYHIKLINQSSDCTPNSYLMIWNKYKRYRTFVFKDSIAYFKMNFKIKSM